jgi:outer membrane protein
MNVCTIEQHHQVVARDRRGAGGRGRRVTAGAIAACVLALGVDAVVVDAQAASGAKIAYIRSHEVLAAAPGATDAQAAFNKEVERVQATEKTWSDSLQGLIADYGKQEATLSATDKDARKKAIQDHQQDWSKRDQELQQQLQQKRNQLIQPIMDQINRVIEDVRSQDGYAMIFDAQADGAAIVAADKNLDLTDRVISKLKSMPPAVAGVSPPTPAKPQKTPAGPVQTPAGVTRPKSPGY